MCQMDRLAFDVGSGIQEYKIMVWRGNNRSNASPIHTGYAPQLESRGCKNTARVTNRHNGIGFALVDECDGANNRAILLFSNRRDGFVLHGEDFTRVDYAHAMIPEAAFGE